MKNKKNSRQDFSHCYQTRMIANIVYSTLLACLVEMFLVTNLTMLAGYAKKSEWDNALLGMIGESDVIIVLGYVLVGILVFSDASGPVCPVCGKDFRCDEQHCGGRFKHDS